MRACFDFLGAKNWELGRPPGPSPCYGPGHTREFTPGAPSSTHVVLNYNISKHNHSAVIHTFLMGLN